MLALGDDVFEELVDGPADGCGGHLVDDPGLDALEEGDGAAHSVDSPKSLAQTGDMAAPGGRGSGCRANPSGRRRGLGLDHMYGLSLLGVEKGLANVEGRGDSGGEGSGQRAGHHVGGGVVLSVGVEEFLQVLVGHEVERLEGHVHGQLGGVAAVEGGRALVSQQRAHAVQDAAVRGVKHLHTLFHH